MEYDPSGSADGPHHEIAEMVANLDGKWLLESGRDHLSQGNQVQAIGLNEELEKTQRLSALQDAMYQKK